MRNSEDHEIIFRQTRQDDKDSDIYYIVIQQKRNNIFPCIVTKIVTAFLTTSGTRFLELHIDRKHCSTNSVLVSKNRNKDPRSSFSTFSTFFPNHQNGITIIHFFIQGQPSIFLEGNKDEQQESAEATLDLWLNHGTPAVGKHCWCYCCCSVNSACRIHCRRPSWSHSRLRPTSSPLQRSSRFFPRVTSLHVGHLRRDPR